MLYKVLAAALALSCVHAAALPVDDAASQHLAPEHLTTTFGASMLEGKMAKKSMSVWPKKVATKDDQSRWTKDMLKAEKDDSIARKSTVAAMRVAAQSVHAEQVPGKSSQYAQMQASTSATGESLEAACVKCEESEGKLTSTLGDAIEKHEKFENVEYHFTKILHAENKLKKTCAIIEDTKPRLVALTNHIKESLARVKLGVDSGFTAKLTARDFGNMNAVFGQAKKNDQLLTMTKDKSKGTCPEACSKADMDTATEAKDAADQEADAAKGDREKACEGIEFDKAAMPMKSAAPIEPRRQGRGDAVGKPPKYDTANMCACTGEGNQMNCSKTGIRYCASHQKCVSADRRPFGDWSMCVGDSPPSVA